jgi:hypothetical protein
MKTYVALYDLHYGFERRSGHKVPLHDPKAIAATLQFIKDFKPSTVIIGGDGLDCGPISHHNHGKPGRIEGLKLITDAALFRSEVLDKLEDSSATEFVYIIGNHEAWIEDLVEEEPGLEGTIDLKSLLKLKEWKIIPQGGYFNLGKLTFIHGDQFKGGDHVAKAAVLAYERNVRLGHFHTFQVYTKNSAVDIDMGRTGVVVPCLCRKDPKYGNSQPNRWVQGFNYGYVFPGGSFNDYVPIIVNGKFVAEGKVYGEK